jgi:hypothetical protein
METHTSCTGHRVMYDPINPSFCFFYQQHLVASVPWHLIELLEKLHCIQ